MTFQASLTASKPLRHSNPWACSFRQALRETLLPVILNTVFFVAVIALFNLLYLITRNGMGEASYHGYKYRLFIDPITFLFPVLSLLTALLQGLLTFRFLFNRNAAHTWFGLGLSRRQLFWSRYAAGAVGALLPLVVSMLATLAMNLALFADVGLVLARFSFFLLGMSLQVLALYSIVVLVCCSTKTVVEGIAFSVILTFVPTMVLMVMNGLMVHLLPGNGYISTDSSYYYSWNTTLVRSLSDWNPLFFTSPYLERFLGEGTRLDPQYQEYMAQFPAMSIRWALIPGWLAVTGALAWAARHVFLRTKVENTGTLGAGRVVDYAGVLALGLFAFGLVFMLPYDVTHKLSIGAMLGIGTATAVVMMLAMAFPLRLLRHRIWKGLLPLGAGLVAMLAICGLLISGGLGYSGYVPQTDAIKSITMSYNGLDFFMPKSSGLGGGDITPIISYENEVTFTEKADIAATIDTHRALIQLGIPAGPVQDATGKRNIYDILTKVSYVMQDGSTVDRSYLRLTPELMKKMMALDGTAAVKQAYRDYLLQDNDNDMQGYRDDGIYWSGYVYLCGPSLGTNRQLNLDEEQWAKLLGCIADDLTTQTPEDRYLAQRPEECILAFLPQKNTLSNRENAFGAGYVYVTEQFTKTLAFLKDNGWLEDISKAAEVEAVVVMDDRRMDHTYDYNALYSFPICYNGTCTLQEFDSYQQSKNPRALPLDDKVRQQEVLSRCHGLYWPGDGGYVVLIKYKGQDQAVSTFLPAKDAPDYVIQGTK